MAQASSEGDGGARPAEVAYLVSQYPAPSHTSSSSVRSKACGPWVCGCGHFSVRPVPTRRC